MQFLLYKNGVEKQSASSYESMKNKIKTMEIEEGTYVINIKHELLTNDKSSTYITCKTETDNLAQGDVDICVSNMLHTLSKLNIYWESVENIITLLNNKSFSWDDAEVIWSLKDDLDVIKYPLSSLLNRDFEKEINDKIISIGRYLINENQVVEFYDTDEDFKLYLLQLLLGR